MKNYWASIILAFGVVVAGVMIYLGFCSMADRDRDVQVRGFSERIVEANKATWPITYKAVGDDLPALYNEAAAANIKIKKFLIQAGIPEADLSSTAPSTTDYNTSEYRPENIKNRYMIRQNITIASKKVKLVRQLTYRIPELVRQGISIMTDDGQTVDYEFTDLDKIKPAMIEASTKNAREAAEKFAKDSGSRLGKIKTASQGLFTIDDRDNNTPWIKKVRVVTSVSYYLKN